MLLLLTQELNGPFRRCRSSYLDSINPCTLCITRAARAAALRIATSTNQEARAAVIEMQPKQLALKLTAHLSAYPRTISIVAAI